MTEAFFIKSRAMAGQQDTSAVSSGPWSACCQRLSLATPHCIVAARRCVRGVYLAPHCYDIKCSAADITTPAMPVMLVKDATSSNLKATPPATSLLEAPTSTVPATAAISSTSAPISIAEAESSAPCQSSAEPAARSELMQALDKASKKPQASLTVLVNVQDNTMVVQR